MITRLNEFRSTEVDEDMLFDILENNCQQFLDGGVHLFRGRNFDSDFVYTDPSADIRNALNTSNHYNMIMSNLPSWDGVPKRDRSVIMTDQPHTASNYGTLYLCIPTDDSDMGALYSGDIWTSFGDMKAGIPYPKQVSKALEVLGAPSHDWQQFSAFMDKLVKFGRVPDNVQEINAYLGGAYQINNNSVLTLLGTVMKDAMEGRSSWVECLERYFDVNKIGHCEYDEIEPSPSEFGTEWWTENICVMVSFYKWNIIEKKYGIHIKR